MATALTNLKAKDSYKDLLHLGAGNVGLTASTPQQVYDGEGNLAPFKMAVDELQMTQVLSLANGVVGAPSLSFANSLTTGLYRSAADTIGIAVAGALDFKISANALNVLSGSTLTIDSGATLTVTGTLTTLTVAQGGTGAVSLTDGGPLLGSGTGAITAMAVLANGEFIVGNGTTDPVAESGTTLRTSIGVGTGDSPQFTAVNIGHASDTTLTRVSAGVVAIEGSNIYMVGGTDVSVADGGTGASTHTANNVLVGNGTSAIASVAPSTSGNVLTSNGSAWTSAAGSTVSTATTSTEGKVELATSAETITGTDTGRVVTPSGLQAKVASATAKGIAELATTAETVTGTDTGRVVTPAGLHGALAGLTDTVVTVSDSFVFSDATDSAALKEDTVQGILDLVSVNNGNWSGTDLSVANGGTGASTFTANNVLLGNGTSALQVVAPSTSGNVLTSNGSTWQSTAVSGGGAWNFLTSTTASNAATANITSGIDGTYDHYVIICTDLNPATDQQYLQMRTSTNGGSSYDSGSADYQWAVHAYGRDPGHVDESVLEQTFINMVGDGAGSPGRPGNGAAEGSSFILHINNPSGTTYYKNIYWQAAFAGPTGGRATVVQGYGFRNNTADIDAVQFFMASGNLDGVFRLYGISDS